jgi:hypothetical protein
LRVVRTVKQTTQMKWFKIQRDQEWLESVGNNENLNDFGTTVI